MIANFNYGGTGSFDYTRIGTPTYDTSYHQGYGITYRPPAPLPLKEMMKRWAKQRMRIMISMMPPDHPHPKRVIYDRPVPLRGVRLNGHGWAI